MPSEGLWAPQGSGGRGKSGLWLGPVGSVRTCRALYPTPHPVPPSPLYCCPLSCPNPCPSPFPAVHAALCLGLYFAPSPALSLGPCRAPCPSRILPHAEWSHKGSRSLLGSVPREQPPLPAAEPWLCPLPRPSPRAPGGCCRPPRAHPAARPSGQLAKQVNSIRAWGWRGARPHCRAAGAVKS